VLSTLLKKNKSDKLLGDEFADLILAIIEITPDFTAPTTTDRLLTLIQTNPDGLTIKQLAESLNRPVSMIQICIKDPIVSRAVVAKMRNDGTSFTKVYLPRSSNCAKQLATSNCNAASEIDRITLNPYNLRMRVGLSRQQLSSLLGLSTSTIDSWESGKSYPKLSPAQLQQMLRSYECTLDELVVAFSPPSDARSLPDNSMN
jgi:DNA-binding transcriptional regulator YiaG